LKRRDAQTVGVKSSNLGEVKNYFENIQLKNDKKNNAETLSKVFMLLLKLAFAFVCLFYVLHYSS
jgi:hypothetical protein